MQRATFQVAQTELPQVGSIADVAARLALWGRRAPKGLARVEFVSDFSRKEGVSQLRATLPQDKPLYEIELPYQQPAIKVVQFLREGLRGLPPGVVSITGFATAFTDDCTLADSLRVLNFHREALADFPLCQIWWMTHPFTEVFTRSIPDLDSWFMLRLSLSETIVREIAQEHSIRTLSNVDLDEARKQSQQYVERFETALVNNSPIGALVYLAIAATALLHNAGLQTEEKHLTKALLNNMDALLSECGLSEVKFDPDRWNIKWNFATRSTSSVLPQDMRLLAQLYERADVIDKPEALYLLSLKLADNIAWRGVVGLDEAFQSLTEFYVRQHRYADAEALCRRWVTKIENLVDDTNHDLSHFHVIIALDQLWEIYLLQKKDIEAEQIYCRMRNITKNSDWRDIDLEVSVLNRMSLEYNRLGRYAEANALSEQRIKLQSKA